MKGEERKEFLKEYKMSLISGSILTISPSLAGILLWDRLPEKIARHFDQHNVANGWSSKPMAGAASRWQFLEFRFCFC